MSREIDATDMQRVDELRLREIQAQYDKAARYLEEGGIHWPPSVDSDLGLNGDVFDPLIFTMVPEMLQELGRRIREEDEL